MNDNNPVDPKVIAGTTVTGVAGFVVVLLMNIIQGEALNVAALEGLISAVVVAVLAFAAAWLKKSGLDVLLQRVAAQPEVAQVEATKVSGVAVTVSGTTGEVVPTKPGPLNEAGHMNAGLLGVFFVVAAVVSLLMILLFRQF